MNRSHPANFGSRSTSAAMLNPQKFSTWLHELPMPGMMRQPLYRGSGIVSSERNVTNRAWYSSGPKSWTPRFLRTFCVMFSVRNGL